MKLAVQGLFIKDVHLRGQLRQISDVFNDQPLTDIITFQQEFGLVLPKWTERFYPKVLQKLTDKSYVWNAYNDELKKLKGGVFLKKAIDDWEKKITEELKQKFLIFAGHDATSNFLS